MGATIKAGLAMRGAGRILGARGEGRTRTRFPPEVFETSVSAIPPLGLKRAVRATDKSIQNARQECPTTRLKPLCVHIRWPRPDASARQRKTSRLKLLSARKSRRRLATSIRQRKSAHSTSPTYKVPLRPSYANPWRLFTHIWRFQCV